VFKVQVLNEKVPWIRVLSWRLMCWNPELKQNNWTSGISTLSRHKLGSPKGSFRSELRGRFVGYKRV